MIIYGSKAVHLKSLHSQSATCAHCGTEGQMLFSVFSRHAHVFWIPFFPIGKKGLAQCAHCKQVTELKHMSPTIRNDYNVIQSHTKTPWWQFSGLALLIVAIFFGNLSAKKSEETQNQYMAAPQKGDVYQYKVEQNYSTLKVTAVDPDSITVTPNDYAINKQFNTSEIDKPENYTTSSYRLSRAQLLSMYGKKDIYGVTRIANE